MTDDPFLAVDAYIDRLFAPHDAVMESVLAAARAAGLPDIQVSPNQGKLLYLLARLVSARRILEVGTLAGYSTLWLARALPEGGRLVTLEREATHAEVARANFARAGLADRIELMEGPALDSLAHLATTEPAPFDLVFLDADKASFPAYLDWAVKLARPGAVILGDNVVRAGAVLDPAGDDPSAVGAAAFNLKLADHPRLEAVILQQVGAKGHDGLAIARVRE